MTDLVKNINSELINSSELLVQYRNIKLQNKDYILLFRVGGFYETYFDDAHVVSKKCSIALTSKHFNFGDINLAGIPVACRDSIIKTLLDKGCKVALCEELDDILDGKIKARKVIRKYTSGVLFDEDFLNPEENNFLCALYYTNQAVHIAFSDVSTNQVFATSIKQDKVLDEILKFKPSEILISSNCKSSLNLTSLFATCLPEVIITPVDNSYFLECDDFDFSNNFALCAISSYLKNGLGTSFSGVFINFYNAQNYLDLSYGALRNLEVLQNMQNLKKEGTLFWVLDKTKTPMGRRLLEYSLKFPLLSKAEILHRQKVVSYFLNNSEQVNFASSYLSCVSDVSRIIIRIKNNCFKIKDFLLLKKSFSSFAKLVDKFNSLSVFNLSENEIVELKSITTFLENNISDDIQNPLNPMLSPDFGFCLNKIEEILSEIQSYEEKLKTLTKIKNLKIIQFKNKFIIQIPRTEAKNAPKDFILYQTLANCTRYLTETLEKLSLDYVLQNANRASIENYLVEKVSSYVVQYSDLILRFSDKIALFDMLFAFSQVALDKNYTCPEFGDDNLNLNCALHPSLSYNSTDFQPTSFEFSRNLPNFVLLTGANMAGKSTLMRQIALISIMAQVGSYVPAESAILPLFDKIFVRFGTLDNIYKNKSSFALEMYDVKQILDNASKNSLILLDELGKSTSTQDGSAIARAVSEYIIEFIGAKTIFATHYHNLKTMYEENVSKIRPIAISLVDSKRIIENGFLDKSHGIKIAQDAGLPDCILERAINYASLCQ